MLSVQLTICIVNCKNSAIAEDSTCHGISIAMSGPAPNRGKQGSESGRAADHHSMKVLTTGRIAMGSRQ
jgi:hypothetical protein